MSYYEKGIFLGPYLLPNREAPVYLEFPVPAAIEKGNGNWDFDYKNQFFELADYHNVAVYEINVASLTSVQPYPLGKSFPDPLTMKIGYSSSISIDEAQKVIDSQPKHPQYWQNRAQMVLYRLASGFAWVDHFSSVLMATMALLSIMWLWFFRSPVPFVIWWGFQAGLCFGLQDFVPISSCTPLAGILVSLCFFIFLSPESMYYPTNGNFSLPQAVCGVCFCIIGPILLLVLGFLFLIKHVIPKQKR